MVKKTKPVKSNSISKKKLDKALLLAKSGLIAGSAYLLSRNVNIQSFGSKIREQLLSILPSINIYIGDAFDKKYKLIRPLGSGAFGSVFIAKNMVDNVEVIVKIVPTNYSFLRSELDVLIRLKKLGCKYTACYIEHKYYKNNAIIVYALDYTDTLKDVQKKTHVKYIKNDIIINLIKGLYLLHKNNIVHLDIKPENIIADKNGDIKYIDFGLSCLRYCSAMYSGTPGYMSPEMDGRQKLHAMFGVSSPPITLKIGRESDIFSLGVVIKELLEGKKNIFTDKQLQLLNDMTNLNPEKRPTIEKLKNELNIGTIAYTRNNILDFFGL
jgi:serine/threonine protein kinase